eukprot:scaffold12578_cov128-Isochrysis_galbana.AAC.1
MDVCVSVREPRLGGRGGKGSGARNCVTGDGTPGQAGRTPEEALACWAGLGHGGWAGGDDSQGPPRSKQKLPLTVTPRGANNAPGMDSVLEWAQCQD